MHSKENKATFQVNILVKYSKGKYKRNGIKHFACAVYNIQHAFKKHI